MPVDNPTRDDRGTLTRITEFLYWLGVQGALLLLAASPTLVSWLLLERHVSNLPLFLLFAVFLCPAVAASLWAWGAHDEDPDPVPARRFLRGYRHNLLDSLKIGVPALVVLTVLTTNIAYGEAVGAGMLTTAFVILAVLVAVVGVRGLSIAATFSFRGVDVLRLAVFTALTMPLRTLSLLSIGVLVLGISLFIGDYAVLLLGSMLTFLLHRSERKVIARVRAQFVHASE